MKYIINYDSNTICECEVLSECKDKYGRYFTCLVYDEKTCDEIEVDRSKVYDSEDDANNALYESIQADIASQSYAEGYCYACGYYD